MIRHLPQPKEQDWRAVMTQLSDRYDRYHQSRACGQPSSGIPSYAGRVELTSHVATCSDRCTEWLHVVLSAPCSTEAKDGSVDVAEQAWSAVGRLRDGLTDAGWCDHPQALADACTASTCPISSRLPWADVACIRSTPGTRDDFCPPTRRRGGQQRGVRPSREESLAVPEDTRRPTFYLSSVKLWRGD